MGSIEGTVERILTEQFEDASTKITPIEYSNRVGGSIVWSGFLGVAQIDRQMMVRNALRAKLTEDDLIHVGTILTFTPEEIEAMQGVAA